jgi:hypothetical protein
MVLNNLSLIVVLTSLDNLKHIFDLSLAGGIRGKQSGTGTGFSPSSSLFPFQYYFTVVLYNYLSF